MEDDEHMGTTTTPEPRPKVADLNLPGGCPACEGPLSVRATRTSAWAYCGTCHWIAHPRMALTPQGINMEYPAAAA